MKITAEFLASVSNTSGYTELQTLLAEMHLAATKQCRHYSIQTKHISNVARSLHDLGFSVQICSPTSLIASW